MTDLQKVFALFTILAIITIIGILVNLKKWQFTLLLILTIGIFVQFSGINTVSDKPQVEHVDQFIIVGRKLYLRDTLCVVQYNVNPLLLLRCKEEIVVRKVGIHYKLFFDDNVN